MTEAADTVFRDGEIHTLTTPDETYEAVAVRDGEIVRLGSTYDVEFLVGTDTDTIDLDGRVLLPGFIDAHTHLTTVGKYLVHADLSVAEDLDEAVSLLRERATETDGPDDSAWIRGYGYDESTWPEDRYLDREDLDAVSEERPVVAFREDMHVASVNSVVIDRYEAEMAAENVHHEGAEPTGVLVEDAVNVVTEAVAPDAEETGRLVAAAQARANELGVTGVHDMVRGSYAPEVYRDMDLAEELSLRVRINYWSDHLDALIETGLRTNHGSGMVRVGAIKSFTDGSFGGRTAKLSEPYHDDTDEYGSWVVDPEELNEIVQKADEAGFQVTAHAIGDEAIDAVLDAFEQTDDPDGMRHRVEHVELASEEAIERFGEMGVVASVQPNFLKWAKEGGLYESRLGARRTETNRYALLDGAGAPLAFGSDCMPMDPLLGVHHAVNTDVDTQRLAVTEALRAYTLGAAYAGFDEGRLGTVETGKLADFTVLDRSPWEYEAEIRDIDVAMTVVDGDVAYDDR
ncbi:amidohydrolase [Halolamina sp. CBA1230]|uniref:amidohydrolase n=1 Tax=Halolamina sp. CBA1230 TaxID=1853690 RepID=UPI0009A1A725|nr:amidohydrolase [Halolamina sp. CBA1230]QKY20732.1 amidohydrolase [Halolamina sp. CBA1230]